MSEAQHIPLNLIDEPSALLRRIDKRSVEYMEIKESVDQHGVLNSVLVRPKNDRYELVDGFVRVSVSRELRCQSIPAIIRDVSDEEVLILQLQANACGVSTKPVEYARRIQKLLELNEDMTLSDIAVMTSKSHQWVKDQLRLLRLNEDIQKLVDKGQLTIGNAYHLARLPGGFQNKFLNDALVLTVTNFKKLAGKQLKQIRENKNKKNLDEAFSVYYVRPYMRSLARIREESLSPVVAPIVCEAEDAKTAVDGFNAALLWVMQMDKCSIKGRERKRAEKFNLENIEENE